MATYRHSSTATQLIQALMDVVGSGCELIGAHEREWASATFSGARHNISMKLAIDGQNAVPPAMIVQLPDHEFSLRGEIVADCTVALGATETDALGGTWQVCQIELLTIAAD